MTEEKQVLYLYTVQGKIEVTQKLRSSPPDKVLVIANSGGKLCIKEIERVGSDACVCWRWKKFYNAQGYR